MVSRACSKEESRRRMYQEAKQGAVVVVSNDEPLDRAHIEDARAVFERCGGVAAPMAVFDLSAVPFMDSAGLEFLLETHEQYQQHGGELKLAAPNSICLDALRVTGVAGKLEIHEQTGTAVRSFLR